MNINPRSSPCVGCSCWSKS